MAVRPVQGRVGVRSGPRRLPLQGDGRPGPFGGGYGVHTVISESDGEYRVRLFIDGEYQAGADYFTDDVVDANETAEAMKEAAYLSDKSSDVAKGEVRDFVADAVDRPHVGEQRGAVDPDLEARIERLYNAGEVYGSGAFERTLALEGDFDDGLISAEELAALREVSEEDMDRWFREMSREQHQEGLAKYGWGDDASTAEDFYITGDEGDEFFHESRGLSSADRALIEGLPGLRPTRGLPAVPPSVPTRLDVSNPPLRPSSSLPPLAGISPTRGLPGLTHAASGEPPRQGRAHPERVPAPYEPLPELTAEERDFGARKVREVREVLEGTRDPGSVLGDDLNPEEWTQDQLFFEAVRAAAASPSRHPLAGVAGAVGGLASMVGSAMSPERALNVPVVSSMPLPAAAPEWMDDVIRDIALSTLTGGAGAAATVARRGVPAAVRLGGRMIR